MGRAFQEGKPMLPADNLEVLTMAARLLEEDAHNIGKGD
jgi:hypothetical protein